MGIAELREATLDEACGDCLELRSPEPRTLAPTEARVGETQRWRPQLAIVQPECRVEGARNSGDDEQPGATRTRSTRRRIHSVTKRPSNVQNRGDRARGCLLRVRSY
eukprot:COSAG03_NODE_273_length_9568_cov_33.245644_3_plen_107_part_00